MADEEKYPQARLSTDAVDGLEVRLTRLEAQINALAESVRQLSQTTGTALQRHHDRISQLETTPF